MQVSAVLKKHNIPPRKSWGQNFLVNEKIAERIISFCDPGKKDIVLEIGPGLGILTRYLAQAAGRVMAVELDKKLAEYLREELSCYKNLDIFCQDILKFELASALRLIPKNNIGTTRKKKESQDICTDGLLNIPWGRKVKVMGNLPYYITTPILDYLIERRALIESAFIMVQREVADRLSASPGTKDYSSISCHVQFYAFVEKLFTIKPAGFYPRPEVASTLLKIDFLRRPAYQIKDEEFLFKVIRAGFNQRRKTLVNALLNTLLADKFDRRQIEQIISEADIDPAVRAETLSLADFVRLADKIGT